MTSAGTRCRWIACGLLGLMVGCADGAATTEPSGADDASAPQETRAAFEARFGPGEDGPTVDATLHLADLGAALEDGATLRFPPGVFQPRFPQLPSTGALPRGVTFEGAGVDATLVFLGPLFTAEALEDFTLRDCTVHTGFSHGVLFDLRKAPARLRLERVRVLGFDSGRGKAALFVAADGVLHAVDCQFLSGYGSRPSAGTQLMDLRDGMFVARFDGCRFEELGLAASGWPAAARLTFVDCAFENVLDDAEAEGNAHGGVRFERCSFSRLPVDPAVGTVEPIARRLDDLFPDWERNVVAR